jgi:hypothetical protein
MLELGAASEDDVVLAFVQAEIDSPIWGPCYQAEMRARGLDRASLIGTGDARANRSRRTVLGAVRGFGRDDGLFRGFPLDTSWRRVSVDPSDFQRLKYIGRDADWLNLSGGSTRLVQDGARNLDSNPRIREKVRGAQREIEQGRCRAELILIEADDSALVVVEGHTRATAYAVLSDRPFLAFLGRSPAMSKWAFC